MTLPTITANIIDLAPGDELILRYRTWEDYESLLSRRHDQAGLRIRYNAATQEIRVMSPLPRHGNIADLLADLVKSLLRYQQKDWQAFTPITLKRIPLQGIEPDYCFYIQNRSQILGKESIDLAVDPPPDLVIEVDLTSMTSVEDFRAIAPAELWIDRQKQLLIFQFQTNQYQEQQRSQYFPEFDLKTLLPQYVERGWQAGSSVAIREFEQLLDQG